MKRTVRLVSLLLALVMCCTLTLTSCDAVLQYLPDELKEMLGLTPETPHEHVYVDGVCSCGQKDPNAGSNPGAGTNPGGNTGDEYQLPLEDGYNQLTLYWKGKTNYATADIWIWYADVNGQGYTFHECSYGGKVVVNIPEGINEVGFIVRTNCSEPGGSTWGSCIKDVDSDRFVEIEGKETVIYLKSGDPYQYHSEDGGKTLVQIKKLALAGIIEDNKIKFNVTPNIKLTSINEVRLYDGDRQVQIEKITDKAGYTSMIGRSIGTGYITVLETLDLGKSYRLEIDGYGSKAVVPTDIFDSKFFADNYHYDGKDLGATVEGDKTHFKVWAPTASNVVLNLFTAGNGVDAYKQVEMVRGDKGVWSHTEACGHGTYYTYSVTTSVGTQEAVDPYAKAAGVNGKRGMVVDLAITNPEGWEDDSHLETIDSYSEAVIWEVHVRDFSNTIKSSNYKGKYLAFTERGLVNEHGVPVGVDYLVNLGITHVHLLPVYDYASVDETRDDQFNWGYDPQNYNVPEGSYSTDPYNGEVRINEYKQMVQALHDAGIGVIMDVVYNHTYDANSNLNKIVPYYYYRYTSTGANSSASGCGNDTASERYMFGKYMVESTAYWVEEYHLDGLRFDLMGLHDLQTMQEVESAVHTVNPYAVMYGEGWTMGATIDGSKQANQSNIGQIKPTGDAIGGIAVFNDGIRDGLKGSTFDEKSKGFIQGATDDATWNKVFFGIKGGQGSGTGWTVPNSMVVNYMSAHDNNTLWDKLILSNGSSSASTRNQMNNLGAAIVLLSKGTPFWQAGEEMLRSKPNGKGGYDHNSYNASDEINNIKWDTLKPGTAEYETMLYYKGLIALRKAFPIFSDLNTTITYEKGTGNVYILTYSDGRGGQAKVILNPYGNGFTVNLGGSWNLVATSDKVDVTGGMGKVNSVNVDSIGVRVLVNDAVLKR